MLRRLFSGDGTPFTKDGINSISNVSGIYVFSDSKGGDKVYYVGKADRMGLQERIQAHWDNPRPNEGSFLGNRMKKMNKNKEGTKAWMSKRIRVHCLSEDELGMAINFAENFAIGVLQPEDNRR